MQYFYGHILKPSFLSTNGQSDLEFLLTHTQKDATIYVKNLNRFLPYNSADFEVTI